MKQDVKLLKQLGNQELLDRYFTYRNNWASASNPREQTEAVEEIEKEVHRRMTRVSSGDALSFSRDSLTTFATDTLLQHYYQFRVLESNHEDPEYTIALDCIQAEFERRMKQPQETLITDLPLHQMSNDVLFIKQGILNKQSADVKAELLRRLENA